MAKFYPLKQDSAGIPMSSFDPNTSARLPSMPKVIGKSKAQVSKMNRVLDNSTYGVKTKDPNKMVIKSLEKGGPINKTGLYRLHKGERVISKSQLNKLANKHVFNSRSSK